MAKRNGNMLGSWAFLIGFILAIIFGFLGTVNPMLTMVLMAIGLIVGLLNVTSSEVSQFLMAGTVLVIVSVFGQEVISSVPVASSILEALAILFVPATLIVALKHVFSLARN